MTIAFIHAPSSFLPEIKAYQDFFNNRNIKTISAGFEDADKLQADVMWYIMGFSTRQRKDVITVHEYSSASTPPLSFIKNAAKKLLNARADYRIYLNEYVRRKLRFSDGVPFGYRDMGIDPTVFYSQPGRVIEYDFIYVGNLHHTRRIGHLLKCFASGKLRDRSLLVLSRDYEQLKRLYSSAKNIVFRGPVPSVGVADYLNKSAFAINYIPDIEPYNQQTSTKLLEYAGCGLRIISTSYPWIKQFQRDLGGAYFFLEEDLSNFDWQSVNDFHYASPDLSAWKWERQILNSGILDFLAMKFPEFPISDHS